MFVCFRCGIVVKLRGNLGFFFVQEKLRAVSVKGKKKKTARGCVRVRGVKIEADFELVLVWQQLTAT